MDETHKKILLKYYQVLKEQMEVKKILPLMKAEGIFDNEDVEKINAKDTRFEMTDLFIEMLQRRGPKAFETFVQSLGRKQSFLAKPLAEEGRIQLIQEIKDNPGMSNEHKTFLNKKSVDLQNLYTDTLLPLIDVLDKDDIEEILSKTTKTEKHQVLQDILPLKGPHAFDSYMRALQQVNPSSTTHLLSQANMSKSESQVRLGAGNDCPVFNSQTQLKDVPKEKYMPSLQQLHQKHEVLGDWTRLYEELGLPPSGKAAVEKEENPTEYMVSLWQEQEGPHATVNMFLEALSKCGRGAVFHEVEKQLGIRAGATVTGTTQNLAQLSLGQTPVKYLNELSDGKLTGLSRTLENPRESFVKMCQLLCITENPISAMEFVNKCRGCKIRDFFKVMRKCRNNPAVEWLRENLPEGSTGPLRHEEETNVRDMNFLIRSKISRIIVGYNNGSWQKFAANIGTSNIDIHYLESMRNIDPMEELLKYFSSRSGSSVGRLYDILVECELETVADEL